MIFTCTDFTGHWPVGTAAVIVARDRETAEKMLREALALHGLPQDDAPLDLQPFPEGVEEVRILNDGNY